MGASTATTSTTTIPATIMCRHCLERNQCRRVWIDSDVGIDDNLAIIAAFGQEKLGKVCIIGIGITDGNIPAWISTATFPKLLYLFDKLNLPFSSPVVKAGGNMTKLYNDKNKSYNPPGGRGSAEHIHGKDGMASLGQYIKLPDNVTFPNKDPNNNPPAFFDRQIANECTEKEKCEVVAIGPLSNMVNAKRLEENKNLIKRVVWNGGSFVKPEQVDNYYAGMEAFVPPAPEEWNVPLRRRGNIAPLSEFNAWAGSESLGEFLTKRPEGMQFYMLDGVASKILWSPYFLEKFEVKTGSVNRTAWNSDQFLQSLLSLRSAHPGDASKENNKLIGTVVEKQFSIEETKRDEDHGLYDTEGNASLARTTFIKDISTLGWKNSVSDGQVPSLAIGNCAYDTGAVAYIFNPDLFTVESDTVTMVTKGTATDKFWEILEEKKFMRRTFNNTLYGVDGAPHKSDLKGATWRASRPESETLVSLLTPTTQPFLSPRIGVTDLKIKTGSASILNYKEFESQPNVVPVKILNWLVDSLVAASN